MVGNLVDMSVQLQDLSIIDTDPPTRSCASLCASRVGPSGYGIFQSVKDWNIFSRTVQRKCAESSLPQ